MNNLPTATLSLDLAWIGESQTFAVHYSPPAHVESWPVGEVVGRISESVTIWHRSFKPLPPMAFDVEDFE